MGPLLTFDKAIQTALTLSVPSKVETVSLEQTANRILAKDAIAVVNAPPFPRAMMDGFAIRAEDIHSPDSRLKIVGSVAAGNTSDLTLQAGQAIRIMTGARMPHLSDSVARFEWCDVSEDDYVRVLRSVSQGESVQPIGEDASKGQVVLKTGARLNGSGRAMCKSFGIFEVSVTIPPTVAIVVTGTELVSDVTIPLQAGQIYGTNDVFLQHAIKEDGGKVVSVHYVEDDKETIREVITEVSQSVDYVLVTGGMSVGDHDYFPHILQELGAEIAIRKVLIRPGSPFIAARMNYATIFGLSGSPAACFIQFETLVRPVIRRTLGMEDCPFPSSGRLKNAISLKSIKSVRIFRAEASIQNGTVIVDAQTSQSPGIMSSLATSNCLIRLDDDELPEGRIVPLRWLSSP